MRKRSDVMKAHSIFVEEKTVYRCACNAVFEDIKRAEAHLRHPPQEKGKSPKPKKHGGKFLRVSFTVSEADCKRFADAFPAVMGKLAA